MDNNILCAFMYFILCAISFIIFLLYIVFIYEKKENSNEENKL